MNYNAEDLHSLKDRQLERQVDFLGQRFCTWMGCSESCIKLVLFPLSVSLTLSHFNSSPSSGWRSKFSHETPVFLFGVCISFTASRIYCFCIHHSYCRPSTTQWLLVVYVEVINLTHTYAHVLPLKHTKALRHSLSLSLKYSEIQIRTHPGCVSASDRQTVWRSEE